jgi:hypothetical protein
VLTGFSGRGRIDRRVGWKGRPVRPLHPFEAEDHALLQSINRGEFSRSARMSPQVDVVDEAHARCVAGQKVRGSLSENVGGHDYLSWRGASRTVSNVVALYYNLVAFLCAAGP